MKRFDRARFFAYGVMIAVNAVALALYALDLATSGRGGAANAQPVLLVLIGVCLIGAMIAAVLRGYDLGRPAWQIVLGFWLSLGTGPVVLLFIGYLAWARGDAGPNAHGPQPAPAGFLTWLQTALMLAAPWLLFLVAARLS
jgi:uncharacterized membrane protein YhaH (DUF805 family)